MQPTLAQVCSLHSPFDKDIEDFAAGACHSMELYFGKLEGYLKTHRVDEALALLNKHDMQVPVASFQGGLFAREEAAREQHWTLFQSRLQLCQLLRIPTVVVALDLPDKVPAGGVASIQESLQEMAQAADRFQIRLALEFQAASGFCNNLQTTVALLQEVDCPLLGICLDAFHFYKGPSKTEDLGYLNAGNLFHVQLCDLAGVTRELAADSDRILPGDGDLPLASWVQLLRQMAYTGPVSVELMNPLIWQIPPRQFGEIAITALRKLLELNSMGSGE